MGDSRMNETCLVRKLISVNFTTGEKGYFADLCIQNSNRFEESLVCKEQGFCAIRPELLQMSYWHPLNQNGLPIDGIIRIEMTAGSWCIMAMTTSKVRTNHEFLWLREIAEELQSKNIRYVPFLRKDDSQNRDIIDAIRLPIG